MSEVIPESTRNEVTTNNRWAGLQIKDRRLVFRPVLSLFCLSVQEQERPLHERAALLFSFRLSYSTIFKLVSAVARELPPTQILYVVGSTVRFTSTL